MPRYKVSLPLIGRLEVVIEADDGEAAEIAAREIWDECDLNEELDNDHLTLLIPQALPPAIFELETDLEDADDSA